MEPPLTDILYSRHLIIHDKMLQSGLNLHYFTALQNADTSLFRKADRFCGPASTWTVQNSLDNADAGRPLAQDCPVPLIDSLTGHYTNTGMHSSSLWLSFSCHRTARESSGTHLRSAQWHEYALPRLLETYRKPPK